MQQGCELQQAQLQPVLYFVSVVVVFIMSVMRNYTNQQTGFTLLEIVVTIVIIAMGTLAVATVSIGTGSINHQARQLALATAAIQQKMEADRNLPFASIPANEDFTSSLPAELASPRSAIATFTNVVAGLSRLDINVSYTDKNHTRSAQVSTLIYQQGIDR